MVGLKSPNYTSRVFGLTFSLGAFRNTVYLSILTLLNHHRYLSLGKADPLFSTLLTWARIYTLHDWAQFDKMLSCTIGTLRQLLVSTYSTTKSYLRFLNGYDHSPLILQNSDSCRNKRPIKLPISVLIYFSSAYQSQPKRISKLLSSSPHRKTYSTFTSSPVLRFKLGSDFIALKTPVGSWAAL